MKYPMYKRKSQKRFSLDLCDESAKFSGDDLTLVNGCVKSRKGFSAISQNAICSPDELSLFASPIRSCNVKRMKENGISSLAYAVTTDYDSVADISFYWINTDGTTQTAGMHFYRVSSDEFHIPEKVVVFSGDCSVGCGIYAFVTLKGYYSKETVIYELSEDESEWISINQDDIYIPVILANGRGTEYINENDFDSLYKPVQPEEQNLLGGFFKAYFGTDGRSSVFRLPIGGLDDDTVVCRLFTAQNECTEWVIYAGNESAAVDLGGVTVTMHCDRDLGIIRFTSGNAAAYPLPMYKQIDGNNLVIIASRTATEAVDVISASEVCCHDSRLYFYGYEDAADSIAVSKVSSPLYFPVGGFKRVNDGESIEKLEAVGDELYAVLSNSIYEVALKKGERFSGTPIKGNIAETLFEPDKLSASLLQKIQGGVVRDTVLQIGGSIAFMGKDRRVYALEKRVLKDISSTDKRISGLSEQLDTAHAVTVEENYLLISGETVLCCNMGKAKRWFLWRLPKGGYLKERVALDQKNIYIWEKPDTRESFAMQYGANEDIFPDNVTRHVEISLDTDFSDFGTPWCKKAIDAVFITAASEGSIKVSFGDRAQLHLCECPINAENPFKTVRIRPQLYGENGTKVKLVAQAPFEITDITFLYRELSAVN